MPSKFEIKRRLDKVNNEIKISIEYLRTIPCGMFIDQASLNKIAEKITTLDIGAAIQESERGLEFLKELEKLLKLEKSRRNWLQQFEEIKRKMSFQEKKKRKLETEAEESLEREVKNPYNLRSTPPQSLE
ncbi:uncharacterized protein LOC128558836 [Mercenaria mercenaria]|uniref:uncharacterized protein LOC128558836 n=1 Tax=Mercenaria mercenaria TaxID=6596 RepID=UPI00234EB14C|nr:uncharacterized protein LOC128558836 [Mercenaria mercenaria]